MIRVRESLKLTRHGWSPLAEQLFIVPGLGGDAGKEPGLADKLRGAESGKFASPLDR